MNSPLQYQPLAAGTENHPVYPSRIITRDTGLMVGFMPQKNSLKTSNVSAQFNNFAVPNPLGLGYRLQMQATDPTSPATLEMFFYGDAFGIIGTVDSGDKASSTAFLPVGIQIDGQEFPVSVSDERCNTITPFASGNSISLYEWVWNGFGDGIHHVLISAAGDRNYTGSGTTNRFTMFGFLVPQVQNIVNCGRCVITAVLSNASTSMTAFNSWNNTGQTPTAITKITAVNRDSAACLLKYAINNSSTMTGEYNLPAAGTNTDSNVVWHSEFPVSLSALQFQAATANKVDIQVYGIVGQ